MLIGNKSRWFFLASYVSLICLQSYSAFHHQLFGDEAFYWLESQHLAWSYAELPGWTQWTIAFSQWLLPQHEFTVRLPSLMAAWSLPWLGMYISQKTSQNQTPDFWQTGLLLLSLPLLAVAGILAIPDIWLTFFGLLATLTLIQGIQSQNKQWFLWLGLVLALGINIHVRFWIIVFLSCIVVSWLYRHQENLIKKLFFISLPVMILGFVPVLLFNLQNDFALFSFQFSERHPWEFQSTQFAFFPTQLLIASPLVFWLCFKVVLNRSTMNQVQLTLVAIAVIHWFIYALIGFYSDNLRFNAHWTVFSYVLLLIVAGSTESNTKLKIGSIITGLLCTGTLITGLFYALHVTQPVSKLNAQITENFRGWQELSEKTNTLLLEESFEYIVADHFMTLAELKFYSPQAPKVSVLTHPSNIKHGREQQLTIMGYKQKQTTDPGLLITEHSALKLEQIIPFYQSACETLNGIQMIDSLDYANGTKSYYYFKTGGGACQIPPMIYLQTDYQQLSGWVMSEINNTPSIRLKKPVALATIETKIRPLGKNPLFQNLDSKKYQLTHFKISPIATKSAYQIQLQLSKNPILSEAIYPE